MRMSKEKIMNHLKERGVDEDQRRRAFDSLPALVELRDHEETLRGFGADIDALTSAPDVEGPKPDDINPEEEGPVGAPNRADGAT